MITPRHASAHRALAAAALVVAGLTVGATGAPQPARGQTSDFRGDECESTGTGAGACLIDEPQGNNPETYGTVTFDRTTGADDDRIVFDVKLQDPDGTGPPTLQEIQICIQPADGRETNPYTPARANSCAGQSEDRVYVDEDAPITEPVTIDLDEVLGEGFTLGEKIFFAVHMTIDDDGESRTVMVTGPVGAPQPQTRTLVVRKDVVDGQGGELFAFTVDCGDYALSEQNGGEAVTYQNGDATFRLGDNGEATFTSIPNGTSCTIGEAVPAGEWATSVNGEPDADRAVSVTLDQGRTVVFTNQAATTPAGNGGTTTTTAGGGTTPTTAEGATTTTTAPGDTAVGGAGAEQPTSGSEQPSGEQPTEVAGERLERVDGLPRTGSAAAALTVFAAGLLAAGTGLRAGLSRRRLSRRSPQEKR
jgi:hypothetical protein